MVASKEKTQKWPPEVLDLYKVGKTIGTGGFASVVIAKRKDGNEDGPELVALKSVASKTVENIGYAHREIYILKEINHPNIMGVVNSWKTKDYSIIALTYSPGPTVEAILHHGGAPSLVFCRVVIAQIIDALAYLHSKAVLHRDIKPDNLIVTGAKVDDERVWSDFDYDKIDTGEYLELLQRWKVTLVDFGFARALGEEDLNEDVGLKNSMASTDIEKKTTGVSESEEDHRAIDLSIHESMLDLSMGRSINDFLHLQSMDRSSNRGRDKKKLDVSISKKKIRALSALGNRSYAAPEVMKAREKSSISGTTDDSIMVTLSKYVSDYGMTADAYSVGATCRYILTGVPPEHNVDEYIANKNNVIAKVCTLVCKANKSKGKAKVEKKYRYAADIPREAIQMIKGLTSAIPDDRLTVKATRMYPYVCDVLTDRPIFSNTVEFLHITEKPSLEESDDNITEKSSYEERDDNITEKSNYEESDDNNTEKYNSEDTDDALADAVW